MAVEQKVSWNKVLNSGKSIVIKRFARIFCLERSLTILNLNLVSDFNSEVWYDIGVSGFWNSCINSLAIPKASVLSVFVFLNDLALRSLLAERGLMVTVERLC